MAGAILVAPVMQTQSLPPLKPSAFYIRVTSTSYFIESEKVSRGKLPGERGDAQKGRQTMLQFLIVLGLAALFVIFGVSISYYLYSRGAVGRTRRVKAFATNAAFDDDDDGEDDDFRIRTGVLVDATSRYARTALLVLLGALVFIALVLVMLFH